MKKTITCALTALMAVSSLSLPVYAQDASTEFSFVKKNNPTVKPQTLPIIITNKTAN